MVPKRPRAYLGRDLPLGCWYNIFQYADLATIARAAAVNRTCRAASHDNRLWCNIFQKGWSPESCGPLQTNRDGKDFCSLYGRWRIGNPASVVLIPGVHGGGMPLHVSEFDGYTETTSHIDNVRLSHAGPLVAWSVGRDKSSVLVDTMVPTLVGTDVTTCQTRYSTTFPASMTSYGDGDGHYLPFLNIQGRTSLLAGPGFLPPHKPGRGALLGLTVFDSIGLVCAGSDYITGWDPRQKGTGPSPTPAFSVEYNEATHGYPMTMISANVTEGDGPPQLLTGRGEDRVLLWDLRFMDRGPVRSFKPFDQTVWCLAREPRHGTLLGAGAESMTCWDWETGMVLWGTWEHRMAFDSLVVGSDYLVAGNRYGTVLEYPLPDPNYDGDEEGRMLADADNLGIVTKSIQGVGEGPERVMAGTRYGSICMWDCAGNPDQMPIRWSLGNETCPGVEVRCLAAIDQVVVSGSVDGSMRIMRVDADFGRPAN